MPDFSTYSSRKALSERLLAQFEQENDALVSRVLAGQMSVADWQLQMREALRLQNALQLIAGAGGDKANVAPDDWLKLGPELKAQYRYLEGFARDLASGNPQALALARSRARMYARSTRASFYRQALPVSLPAVPGDGSTPCGVNCDCDWQIAYETNGAGKVVAILATWVLGETERHCGVCPERANTWNPLRIPVNASASYDPTYF